MAIHIEKVNVTNQVVEFIRSNIAGGNWEVGSKIPSENQLTEALGVSRASIRAAIRHFVGLGVLESVHGKGTFVISDQMEPQGDESTRITPDDCKDMQKVLEFRWIVETEACYKASLNADAEMLGRLKVLLDKMVESVGNQETFVQADMDFHMEICKGSENPLIIKCMQLVYNENKKNFRQINDRFGYKDGIYYHTLIFKAMEEENANAAKDYMQEHLRQALDRLEIER
jgi:GntR family transcriptional repressor for pyruvate dehydrogenase complex